MAEKAASFGQRRDIPKTVMRQYAEKWRELPLPRLQLRWNYKPCPKSAVAEEDRVGRRISIDMGLPFRPAQAWDCFYELVIPLDKSDIRNELYEVGFGLIPMSSTRSCGSADNPPGSRGYLHAPFRDGAHAFWDSKALNWLPIYVIAPDGAPHHKTDYHDAPAHWKDSANA